MKVAFTQQEIELIRNYTIFFEPELEKKFNLGEIEKDKIIINLSVDEIEDLIGYLSAEVNHTEDKKLQILFDILIDKLEDII